MKTKYYFLLVILFYTILLADEYLVYDVINGQNVLREKTIENYKNDNLISRSNYYYIKSINGFVSEKFQYISGHINTIVTEYKTITNLITFGNFIDLNNYSLIELNNNTNTNILKIFNINNKITSHTAYTNNLPFLKILFYYTNNDLIKYTRIDFVGGNTNFFLYKNILNSNNDKIKTLIFKNTFDHLFQIIEYKKEK